VDCVLIGIPVLAGAWWAFRPEKLFINQKVNEAAPAALSAEPETLLHGKTGGKVHRRAEGRRYKSVGWQRVLRLSDSRLERARCPRDSGEIENKALDGEIVKGDLTALNWHLERGIKRSEL